MSTENNQGSAQNDQAGGEGQNASRDSVSYETHQRLLSEKKKAAAELAEKTRKLQELEEKNLQEQGKWKEMADAKAKEAKEWQMKHDNAHKHFAKRALKAKVNEVALQIGAQATALDDIFVLASANDSFKEIEFGDDYEVSTDQVKEVMTKMQAQKPFLFQKSVPPTKDVSLTQKITETKKDFAKMSKSDLLEEYKKLIS